LESHDVDAGRVTTINKHQQQQQQQVTATVPRIATVAKAASRSSSVPFDNSTNHATFQQVWLQLPSFPVLKKILRMLSKFGVLWSYLPLQ